MSEVKNIIQKARDYYFNQWRGHEETCPAFREKVYLTNLGWNHIVHHKRRLLVDKIIRLKKLSLAREVLKTATTYQTVKNYKDITLYGFRAIVEDTVVKVVVSQKKGSEKKELFSVMFKNLSRQKQRNIWKHNEELIRKFKRENPRPRIRRK